VDDFCSLADQSFSHLSTEHYPAMLWLLLLPSTYSELFHVVYTTGTSSYSRKSLKALSHEVCAENFSFVTAFGVCKLVTVLQNGACQQNIL